MPRGQKSRFPFEFADAMRARAFGVQMDELPDEAPAWAAKKSRADEDDLSFSGQSLYLKAELRACYEYVHDIEGCLRTQRQKALFWRRAAVIVSVVLLVLLLLSVWMVWLVVEG